MMSEINKKIQALCEASGYDDPLAMLEEQSMDSVNDGICMMIGCDYTTQVEPDNNKGWCEVCEKPTVCSISMLMGVM